MINPWIKLLAIVAVLLLGALAVTKWQLSNAKDTIDQQAANLTQQKEMLLAQNAAIGTLQDNARRNEQAQAELRNKLSLAGKLAASRGEKLTRLLNENEALRRWYGTTLPDDIKRMHTRPAFDDPADYLRWLSESNELLDTGQQPGNKR